MIMIPELEYITLLNMIKEEKPENVVLDSDQIKAIEKAATPHYMGVELIEPRPGTFRQRVKKPI